MSSPIVVAYSATPTNLRLGAIKSPAEALELLRPGDVALGRLDVLPTLDGVEPGLAALDELEARGVTVLNGRAALTAAHDKLATAATLAHARVPHPATAHVTQASSACPVELPVVIKPRFGSWGTDVVRCDDELAFAVTLQQLARRSWFAATGAVVQALVPPRGFDLRVLVAGGQVVGAARRVAAAGEWRTNVALGARREQAVPDPGARTIALAAAAATRGDLVGVDLLPVGDTWIVLEVNGAVDFNDAYSFAGADVFAEARAALFETRRSVAVEALA